MGLFRKQPAACPICDYGFPMAGNKIVHWLEHAYQIPKGQPGAGGFTWTCVCGPATQYWPQNIGAAAGLGLHMQEYHGIQRS